MAVFAFACSYVCILLICLFICSFWFKQLCLKFTWCIALSTYLISRCAFLNTSNWYKENSFWQFFISALISERRSSLQKRRCFLLCECLLCVVAVSCHIQLLSWLVCALCALYNGYRLADYMLHNTFYNACSGVAHKLPVDGCS